MATTNWGTIDGKKKMARYTERPKIWVLSSVAMAKAEITPAGELKPTHHSVCLRTMRKVLSLGSRV